MARDPNVDIGSPRTHGWTDGDNGIEPILYEGLTASELIDGMVCVCKGKNICGTECSCYQVGLACLEFCKCEEDSKLASVIIAKLPS